MKRISKNFYSTLIEASEASRALDFNSQKEYQSGRHKDLRLPSKPEEVYKREWQGWRGFLQKKVLYPTLLEASKSAKKLGFGSIREYKEDCHKDLRLPKNPANKYKDEWENWHNFLGIKVVILYSTLLEASKAAKKLGFSTEKEYRNGYHQDPQLPSHPNRKYKDEWQGWIEFLGVDSHLYLTLNEAAKASQALGFTTSREYNEGRHQDAKLPSSPEDKYKDEWQGWRCFLGKPIVQIYSTLTEASKASQALGFSTFREYSKGRHKDPRLPAKPSEKYKTEWQGSDSFLGKVIVKFYPKLSLASKAVRLLGFVSIKEYNKGYRQDPRLPSNPSGVYQGEWQGWKSFLGKGSPQFYPTLCLASQAAKAFGFNTINEYKKGRHQDLMLPSSPNIIYKNEWQGWSRFLGKTLVYASLSEASEVAQALGFDSGKEYKKGRHQDLKLPANPKLFYKGEWQGWPRFLGKTVYYETLSESSKAAQALGFSTMVEYKDGRHQDRRLPLNPRCLYKDDWHDHRDFLGIGSRFYPTLAEASEAAQVLGFRNIKEYREGYHQDSYLPSKPENLYKDDWQSYRNYLGIDSRFYPTLAEASEAAKILGLSSARDYKRGRHQDARLPYDPSKFYEKEWQGIRSFLGFDSRFYLTLAEASEASRSLGCNSKGEYNERRYQDPRLPSNPNEVYMEEWQNWSSFLGTGSYYLTLGEASLAAKKLGASSIIDYQERRHVDPRLPHSPQNIYPGDWKGLEDFLLPIKYECLDDVKRAVKILKIKNSKVYRNEYKNFFPLPAHPDRKFKDEWIDWYDLCDIPRPYIYEEAVELIFNQGLSSKREYIDFIIRTNDLRLPRAPDQVYEAQWISWHVYLGNKEPYRIKYIRPPYNIWADIIREFLKGARGGKGKESHLCRFIRYYIQAYEMGESPQIFLTLDKKDIRPFRKWLDENETKLIAHKTLTSVNEFLDYVITHYLTDEDEESGELVIAMHAHNPFSNLSVDYSSESNTTPSESVKYALAYQYVNAARQWIIPKGAINFSDLKHLQQFNADWFDIDCRLIDSDDPNCVTRTNCGKLQIWFPAYWLHTYALMSVPARGVQLAYCDSGEADSIIPKLTNVRSIEWVKNFSPLAGQTSNEGFVKHYENGEIGMHFTTNKTSFNKKGYSVAWMPESLAYWMISLREWQTKYNSISRAMPWVECEKTSLNEQQRLAKGSNCFLFRDFGSEESGHFSGRLATRLAASLYNTQPKDLSLATLSHDKTVLNHYSSRYTPHSMRVSLITAYVEEFRLPLHVIMKVAGHSSIVMTIYYCKMGSEELRHRFAEGEKVAMQSKSYAAQRMIEQGRIDEIKNELIATSEDALQVISNQTPVGNYLFRDYGICPYGGTRCSDGGSFVKGSRVRQPVSNGYLGSQNCISCRHFVTGPAFIGGLLSISNEISLASHLQYEHYSSIEVQLKKLNKKINELDDEAYDIEASGGFSSEGRRNSLELKKRKTLSESEAAAKKLDALLCDINKSSKLIKQCQALVNNDVDKASGLVDSSKTKLIVQQDHELEICYEETSLFRQLSEVCENAEIYQSASSEMALAPRSQCLDRMALRNHVPMHMFTLDKEQQLVIGNQITKLMLDRLKSWSRVDELIEGKICLEDLAPEECITRHEFSILSNPKEKCTKNNIDSLANEVLSHDKASS